LDEHNDIETTTPITDKAMNTSKAVAVPLFWEVELPITLNADLTV